MDAPIIAVDIGNTRTKFALWYSDPFAHNDGVPSQPDSEWHDSGVQYELTSRMLAETRLPRSANWIFSSVNSEKTDALRGLIAAARPNDAVRVLTLADIPLKVEYDHPDKLGVDRAVAAFAGRELLGKGTPFLTVDVGTAATVDYVDGAGVFRGGAILPGPRLIAEALRAKTAALPMLADPENADLTTRHNGSPLEYPATETTEGIRLGVVYTLVGAILSFYWKTRSRLTELGDGSADALTLLLAGGDAGAISRALEAEFDVLDRNLNVSAPRPKIKTNPRLVLYGLAALAPGVFRGALKEENERRT